MDNDIPGIHKHPFSRLLAFRGHMLIACLFKGIDHMRRKRADMALRRAAGNHHTVGKIRFTREIDRHKVFGFMLVEGRKNQAFKLQ